MMHSNIPGVPDFCSTEYAVRRTKYCLLIPILNEGERIVNELCRAMNNGVDEVVDIVICDGGSKDGSVSDKKMQQSGVNTLLIKTSSGKLSAQLRMGIWFSLERGYEGIITVDGNDKDSIEDVPCFIDKLNEGYDFVQGSRFMKDGKAINTPLLRYVSVKMIHAPIISFTAGERFTDTTNAFRAYSRKYLEHPQVQPLRDIFMTYELLAYLSVRASQLRLKTCEIPVTRAYPPKGKTPTKISPIKGNSELLRILFKNYNGDYTP